MTSVYKPLMRPGDKEYSSITKDESTGAITGGGSNVDAEDENGVCESDSNRLPSSSSSSSSAFNISSPSPPPQRQTMLFKLVAVAATTAATLGYDVGSMAGAIGPLSEQFEMTSVQKEVAMGSLNFIAAGGALIAGPIADKFGRKYSVGFTCWLFLVGTIFMTFATSYGALVLGRMMAGLGVGVAFVAAPVFISEASPSDKRGELNTTFDVAINVGILLGYVFAYLVQLVLPVAWNWRIMLGLGGIFPIVVLCFLSGLPESPRWLMISGEKAAAEQVLQELGSDPEEVKTTISAMEEELACYRDSRYDGVPTPRLKTDCCGLQCRRCELPGKAQRLALGFGFWQQISGTEAVLYYSADYLYNAGLQNAELRLLGNVAVGLSKLIPELVSMRIVDQVGRRPLLMTSSFFLTVFTFLLGVSFSQNWSPVVVVILLCLVMGSFSVGVGPFTFLCASENLSMNERAWGMTMCAALNRCTSGIVALTAVSISDRLGDSGLFYLYGVCGVGASMFYCRVVPETACQSLEELAAQRRLESSTPIANDGPNGSGSDKELI